MATVENIQKAIFDKYVTYGGRKKWKLFAKNCCAIGWECDLIAVTDKDLLCEFEVKRSRADFKKDFEKHKHNYMAKRYKSAMMIIPNHFYFVCPERLVAEAEIPEYAGLIYIGEENLMGNSYLAWVVKEAPLLHAEKANEKVKEKIAISLMYQQFNRLSTKIIK